MTKKITAAVAVAYSVLYVALAYALFSESILSMDYSSLSTTQGLSKAFSDSTSVLAGWAHFIVCSTCGPRDTSCWTPAGPESRTSRSSPRFSGACSSAPSVS